MSEATTVTAPALSVVIPTRDRRERLVRTLRSLGRQALPPDGFEVVVVDDHSRDAGLDHIERQRHSLAAPLTALRNEGRGPAAARNSGAAAARGRVLLFLGDDMEPPGERLLVDHAALHEARPEQPYAVLGRATWMPGATVTPLMRWLEESGLQFDYARLPPGPVDAARALYASHVSLKRGMFDSVGGFDSRFPDAAIEDTDLGVRLAEAGVILDYRPELLVHHDHPTTLAGSLDRTRRVGRSASLYNRLHPEQPHPAVKPPRGPHWEAVRLASPILRRVGAEALPAAAGRLVWPLLHRAAYASGYRQGPPDPGDR